MTVRRLLPRKEEPEDEQPPDVGALMLADWLTALEGERDAVIMRLRQIERILIKYGRLPEESLPRRVR